MGFLELRCLNGFPKRYDGELRETLFRSQGSQVSMRMAMAYYTEVEEAFPEKVKLELSSEGWAANFGEKWVEGLSRHRQCTRTKSGWILASRHQDFIHEHEHGEREKGSCR